MNYRKTLQILLTLCVAVVFIGGIGAQNLLKENEYYRQAQDLKQQAREAIDEGEYDRATELSEEAQELMAKAESYAEEQVRIYRARGWKNRAEDHILWAEGVNAEERFPDKWKAAQTSYEEARKLFGQEKWSQSIEASRKTISIVKEIEPRKADAEVKPRYYVVRLIPEDRDCFSKIAGYDFVYDDPGKWRSLYEENRQKLLEPDNPHLIHPGTKLRIPSIAGERRNGTWDPEE